MKPIDVKLSMYIYFNKENNKESVKFKVGDDARISKYKKSFAKDYVPNWSEEVFVIKKAKYTIPWTYVSSEFKGEEIVGTFYQKERQKTKQTEFRIEKVVKRKCNKLYITWKSCDNSFNSFKNATGVARSDFAK